MAQCPVQNVQHAYDNQTRHPVQSSPGHEQVTADAEPTPSAESVGADVLPADCD